MFTPQSNGMYFNSYEPSQIYGIQQGVYMQQIKPVNYYPVNCQPQTENSLPIFYRPEIQQNLMKTQTMYPQYNHQSYCAIPQQQIQSFTQQYQMQNALQQQQQYIKQQLFQWPSGQYQLINPVQKQACETPIFKEEQKNLKEITQLDDANFMENIRQLGELAKIKERNFYLESKNQMIKFDSSENSKTTNNNQENQNQQNEKAQITEQMFQQIQNLQLRQSDQYTPIYRKIEKKTEVTKKINKSTSCIKPSSLTIIKNELDKQIKIEEQSNKLDDHGQISASTQDEQPLKINSVLFCDLCNYSTKKKDNLNKHKSYKHSKFLYHCIVNNCNHISQNRQSFTLHLRKVHKIRQQNRLNLSQLNQDLKLI